MCWARVSCCPLITWGRRSGSLDGNLIRVATSLVCSPLVNFVSRILRLNSECHGFSVSAHGSGGTFVASVAGLISGHVLVQSGDTQISALKIG